MPRKERKIQKIVVGGQLKSSQSPAQRHAAIVKRVDETLIDQQLESGKYTITIEIGENPFNYVG